MYELDGIEYSLEEVTLAAQESNMSLEDYLQEYGILEKQEATEEAANTVAEEDEAARFIAEDEAAIENMNTELNSENISLDYEKNISEIEDDYSVKYENITNTGSYSDKFKEREYNRILEEKNEALRQNSVRKTEQNLKLESKLGRNDDGSSIHDWMLSSKDQDVKVTDQSFNGDSSELTKTLQEAYPDYEFKTRYITTNPFLSSIGLQTAAPDAFDYYKDKEVGVVMTDPKTGDNISLPSGRSAFDRKEAIVNFIDKHGYDKSKYTERDKNKKQELEKIEEITSVSDEEEASIEQEVNSPDLFNPYMVNQAVGGGSGTVMGTAAPSGYTPMDTRTEVQPYSLELDQAKKMLEASNSLANSKRSPSDQLPAPTKEEIETTARIIIQNQKIQQLKDDKWTDFLENNQEEQQAVLKYYKAVSQDKSFTKVANLQKLQEVGVEQLEGEDKKIVDEFERIYSSDEEIFNVPENETKIELKNGKIVSETQFNSYLASAKNLTNTYDRLVDRQNRINIETDNIKDIDSQFDLLRRDYDTWSKSLFNISSGFATIGAGTAYVVGKVAQGLTYAAEEISGDKKLEEENTISSGIGDFLDETAENFFDAKDEARNTFARDVSFENAFDLSDGGSRFGRFLAQEFSTQAPILATIVASGGTYAPYVIGAYAMGEKYMDMDVEDLKSGKERSELLKFGVSLGYGAAESVFEALTTVAILKRGSNYIKAAQKAGGRTLFKDVNQAIKMTFKDQWKRVFITEPMLEAGGESMTQMTQNLLDGNPILSNVGHAAFSGAMFGMSMSVAPVMYGMALAKFQDPKLYDEYDGYIKSIIKINKSLNKKGKTKRNIDALTKLRSDLQAKADANLKQIMKLTNNSMDSRGFNLYNQVTAEQSMLREAAEEILNNPKTTKQQKQSELKVLNELFNSKQNSRDLYRNSKAFGNKFALLQEGTEEQKQQARDYESRAIENIRVRKGESLDYEPDYNERAKEIENLMLEDEIKSQADAANKSTGIEYSLQTTNKQAKDTINNAKEIEGITEEEALKAEKKRIIDGIDSGKVNGVDNVDGVSLVFMENAIKNGRSSTSIHEPSHQVFRKILQNQPGDFSNLRKEVEGWLKRYDTETYNVIINNKTDLASDEEFIMEFMEQIASGNINFDKTNNKDLATIFGFLSSDAMAKSENFDLNLKGQTDAVDFLITLAAKLRTGTLTESDISDARESSVIKNNFKKALAGIDFVKEAANLSKEQDDRNIKYRNIFNKRFRSMTREEYLKYMLVDGIELKDGGVLTPEGRELYKSLVKDFGLQIMQLSKFDENLAASTIAGPFLQHLVALNPETQLEATNPIAGYMGNFLPFKVGTAKKQDAKGAAPANTVDIDAQVEGRRQFEPVADEQVVIPEELNFTRASGVLPGSDMYNAILKANELVLGTKLPKLEYTRKKKGQPEVVVTLKEVIAKLKNKDTLSRKDFQQAELDYTRIIKDFRNNIASQYESILYDNIKESLGKSDERLLELKDAVVNKLSIADLVAMERLSKNKIFAKLDRKNLNVNEIPAYEGTGRLVYSNPKSGPNLYTRLDPSPKEFVDFFKKRGRDEALIKNLAKTYGFDGTMQVMTEQSTIDKITNRNPELNYLVADDVIQVMASAIDRGVQSKLSQEIEKDFNNISNPTVNNFQTYMEDKDRLIKLLLDVGYNVGFAEKIKDTKKQVRSIVEGLYSDKLNGPEITKIVNRYAPLVNKFGRQISEYPAMTNFPLKEYIDGSLSPEENAALNAFWNLKNKEGESINIGNLYTAEGLQKQKAFINLSIDKLVELYEAQGKTKLDLAIDFILFKGGFEDGGLDRKMIYGNDAAGDYNTKKEAQEAVNNSKYKLGEIIKRDDGKYRVSGGHVEVFNKELLEANFGITSYKSKTKDGVTTWTLVVNGVTREVIGPKKYPQETTMDMVTNNMSQQEIDGRNEYSDRAWNFVTTYYKVTKKMIKDDTATNINAAMLMKSFNDNMKGPMRAAGRLTYVPTNIDTKGYNKKNIKKLFEYEHGIPSSKMNLLIADVIFNNNKDVTLSKLKQSYQVGIITKGFNDNFGRFFQDTMPFSYQYGDNPLTRWFNEYTIGGEVTELFNIQTGKVVKESIAPAKLWNSVKQAKASNEVDLSNNVVKMSMESYKDLDFKADAAGNMSAKFKVGNKNYNIDFYPVDIEDTAYVIEFDQDNKQGVTGSGNAFKTMGIVYNSLTNLIKNNPNVETVEFSALAKDKSRVKLYNTMLEKLGADLGWETDIYTVKIFGKLSGYDYELARPEGKVSTPVKASMETNEDIIGYAATVDEALNVGRKLNAPIKKIRIFDFDDTLARSNSKVIAIKEGQRTEMNAEDFASNGAQMLADGYNFDFTDFNIVRDGKPGPLLNIAKKIQAARGTEDVFVLTARAPESQRPIKEFLDSVGLNIPLSNITGLGNSTGAAKAKWVVEKAADGYNDFYFADDAYQNVKAVRDAMSVLDVKSKVQQAKMSLEQDINKDFNDIVQQATGIRSEARYSEAKGKIVGAKKGKFKFFIPYSAEDFLGLIYPILPKGKKGDSAMKWFKERLMDPYTRAQNNLSTFRKNMMEDFKKLKEDLDVPKDLKETNESGFSNEQAVRVYIWNKQGMPIPGLSKTDTKELLDIIESKPNLKEFGDQIIKLNKNFGYVAPSEGWLAGTITTDLIDGVNKNVRRKYLEEWQANVDIIFSQDNINKLEAAFGTKYVEALRNSLERMKQGKNRLATGNRLSNKILDYINNANGVVMFLNIRSAVLQTISNINFINWSFNNPIKAGKAFANQAQYWKDFKFLMNSDFLVDRRNGLRINISENEIANAANTSGNKAQAAIAYILQKGYAPTQFADSFAIATGGAMFYRNRINDLMKNEGKTEAEAKEQAMLEFREKAEESQQSSDPMRISQQQSSDAGRLILAYANTPMQYARMQKRAFQDLANGRGDNKTNVSKIIYYGVLQNLIFNALQQAVFALGFNSEDDDDEERKKAIGVANGMADSLLRGLGMGGAAVAVAKNFLLDIYERSGRKRPEYVDSIYKLLQFSPPISSKISRVRGAAYQLDSKKRRKKAMEDFGLDNPGYEAGTKVISAVTNVPLDRLLLKMKNIDAALDEETEWWQSVAMLAGWPEWQVKPQKKSSQKKSLPKSNNRRKPIRVSSF